MKEATMLGRKAGISMLQENDCLGRKSLDLHWKFTVGDFEDAQKPDFNDGGWKEVRTPHDWSIEGPFDRDNPSGGDGAYLPCGVGWYRRHLKIPAELREKKIFLEFDGVYMNCEVWLNGKTVARHWYGYTSFQVDLTSELRFGEDNVLAVRVDNSQQPNSRWYSGSGIFRHVWLNIKNMIHIPFNGVAISFTNVSENGADVHLETRLQNETDIPQEAKAIFELADAEKNVCIHSESRLFLYRDGTCRQEAHLLTPTLWTDRNPYLYRATVSVKVGGKESDRVSFACGVRSAVFDAEKGFLLNGKRVKLKGVCLHHDGGCVGAAVPEQIWERRLRLLREMGCNAIRTSHNPPAPELLDLFDQMGFLVMEEAFDEWTYCKIKNIAQRDESNKFGYSQSFRENAKSDLTDMLRRDRNHPCIVLWSVGNEIPEQSSPEGAQILRRLVAICHREAPDRMVTSACDKIMAEPDRTTEDFMNALDVVGYNYVDRWRNRTEILYEDDHFQNPGRRIIGSENRSVAGIRGEYPKEAKTKSWWSGPYTTSMVLSEKLWKFNLMHDYVAGDFIWTGIDYLGEARWPDKNASCAPIDLCGFRKDAFYFYQSIWTEKPMIHIFPHWNWHGKEGTVIPVICYTNCDSAELFLNGRSFGKKCREFPTQGMTETYGHFDHPFQYATTSDLHLSWNVPYEPGTLKVVGEKNGRSVCTEEITTTGEACAVALESDRESIRADGSDLFHVTVKITDREGRVVPTADNLVTFEVEGPGDLIGVDNGKPDSHESFQADHRKAFNGLCLALVRSSGGSAAGAIRVTASSEQLRGASLVVQSR